MVAPNRLLLLGKEQPKADKVSTSDAGKKAMLDVRPFLSGGHPEICPDHCHYRFFWSRRRRDRVVTAA